MSAPKPAPEAKKFKPEQFFDDSVVKELEKEGFFRDYWRGDDIRATKVRINISSVNCAKVEIDSKSS